MRTPLFPTDALEEHPSSLQVVEPDESQKMKNNKTIRASTIIVPIRSLNSAQATAYVGGRTLFDAYTKAGWIEPYIRQHRLVRFDTRHLDAAIVRHQLEGLPQWKNRASEDVDN